MTRKQNGLYLGTVLVLAGSFALLTNLGYVDIGVEALALVFLALGGYFLANYLSGIPSFLFPALLFIFLSVPFWLTLKGLDTYSWMPALWVLAPGLAFLGASLQGGPFSSLVIPGSIVTAVGVFLIIEDQFNISFETVIAAALIVAGLVVLWRSRQA